MMKAYLVHIMALMLIGCCARAADESFGPWSVSSGSPVVATGSPAESAELESNTLGQDYCFMLLNFYQNILSVVSISRCPMEPSCSNYSIDAIEKHGPLVGVMMTADRLFHEGHEQKVALYIWRDGKPRFMDPVENNDFWWYEEE